MRAGSDLRDCLVLQHRQLQIGELGGSGGRRRRRQRIGGRRRHVHSWYSWSRFLRDRCIWGCGCVCLRSLRLCAPACGFFAFLRICATFLRIYALLFDLLPLCAIPCRAVPPRGERAILISQLYHILVQAGVRLCMLDHRVHRENSYARSRAHNGTVSKKFKTSQTYLILVPLSEKRHRLYPHEIPEVLQGLVLRL